MDDSQDLEWLDEIVITEQVLSVNVSTGQAGESQSSEGEELHIFEQESDSPRSNYDDYSPPSSLSSSQCSTPSLEPVPTPDSPLPERHSRVIERVLNDGPDFLPLQHSPSQQSPTSLASTVLISDSSPPEGDSRLLDGILNDRSDISTVPLQARSTLVDKKSEAEDRRLKELDTIVQKQKDEQRILREIDMLIDSIVVRRLIPSPDEDRIQRIMALISSSDFLPPSEPLQKLRGYLRINDAHIQLKAAGLLCILLQHQPRYFGKYPRLVTSMLLHDAETVILDPSTSSLVRELLIDILGAMTNRRFYYRYTDTEEIWRRVRPPWKPIMGMESWPDLATLALPTPISTDGSNSLTHAPNTQMATNNSLETGPSPPQDQTEHAKLSPDIGSREQHQTHSTFFNATLFAYLLALALTYGTMALLELFKVSTINQAHVTENPGLTDQPGE